MTIDKKVVSIYLIFLLFMILSAIYFNFESNKQNRSLAVLCEQYNHLMSYRKSKNKKNFENSNEKYDLRNYVSKISACFSSESDCQFEYKVMEIKNGYSIVLNGRCKPESFVQIIRRIDLLDPLCIPEEYSFSVDSYYIKFMFKFTNSRCEKINFPVANEFNKDIFYFNKSVPKKSSSLINNLEKRENSLIELGSSFDDDKKIEITFFKDIDGKIIKRTRKSTESVK